MLKRIVSIFMALMLIGAHAQAYDVVNLPHSMSFAEAMGAYDSRSIASATLSDIDKNIYVNLSREEIEQFYETACDMTVWRKVNPTPFRGACVNFTLNTGETISYYYNAGIQVGLYGAENFICYMPSSGDQRELLYLMDNLYDPDREDVYGGAQWNVVTNKDFLKLPKAEWAKKTVAEAAGKSLVPYEFTDKYDKNITREEMAILICNFIAVTGNYANMDEYMKATDTVYLYGSFEDCTGRDESIDCLYALGIINGVDGVNFNPDGLVTRQEAAAFMSRAAGLFMHVGTTSQIKTTDWAQVSSWAYTNIRWCIDKGLMQLDDYSKIYPVNNMTVEQAITVLSRLHDIAKNSQS